MAARLCASAPSETSAQTGLLASLRGLFCLLGMCLQWSSGFTPPPENVSLRQPRRAERPRDGQPRARDNTLWRQVGPVPARPGGEHFEGPKIRDAWSALRILRGTPKSWVFMDLTPWHAALEREPRPCRVVRRPRCGVLTAAAPRVTFRPGPRTRRHPARLPRSG